MGALLNFFATLEDAGECWACGVRFAMPANLLRQKREDKTRFYCPNGHPMMFTESATTRLERELAAEKALRERITLERDAARKESERVYKTSRQVAGKLKALKQRVKNGVCPCCQRSFTQLARHMATKHPDYKVDVPEVSE